jgi:putative transposase
MSRRTRRYHTPQPSGSEHVGSRAWHSGFAERNAMIMREHELSISKQAKALRISRGRVYYLPRPVSATDLEIVGLLDRLHLDFTLRGLANVARRCRGVQGSRHVCGRLSRSRKSWPSATARSRGSTC